MLAQNCPALAAVGAGRERKEEKVMGTNDECTHDLRGDIAVLSSDQIYALVTYWTDGLCPVCFTEIPDGDVVCDDCCERAVSRRL